jgi:hypothetical protein
VVICGNGIVAVARAALLLYDLFELRIEGEVGIGHGIVEGSVSGVLLAEEEVVEGAELVEGVGGVEAAIAVALVE